jgi:putative phosphoesterase
VRLGVLADIHGNLPALEACWQLLGTLEVDLTVCLGDLVQYGPYPAEVVDFVREHGIECVQGNCDRAVARGRKSTGDVFESTYWEAMAAESLNWTASVLDTDACGFLRKLPMERRFDLDRVKVLCVHGLPGDITGELPDTGSGVVADHLLESGACRVLLAGHTHEMRLIPRPGGLLANPGSAGGGTLPGEASMALLDVDSAGVPALSWYRVSYDLGAYMRKFRLEGLPDTFLKCIRFGRDPRGRWHVDQISWMQKWAEH